MSKEPIDYLKHIDYYWLVKNIDSYWLVKHIIKKYWFLLNEMKPRDV